MVWGFVGSHHAKFKQFWPSLSRLRSYLKTGGDTELGHNPLGALSVFTLLSLILIQAVSGLFNTDELFLDGPLVVLANDSLIEFASEAHELIWLALQVFIALHIAAIIWYRVTKERNLVRAMWFGSRVPRISAHKPRSLLFGLIVWIVIAAVGWGLGALLPEPEPLYW
jgi:cytochrome b